MMTWVGSVSTNLPCKKVIMMEAKSLSNSLRASQTVPALFLCVGEGKRKSVRRVGSGRFCQAQQALHHFCHGNFLRGAIADDRLFDLPRSQFVNLQA